MSPLLPYYLFLLAGEYFPHSNEEERIDACQVALNTGDPIGTMRKSHLLYLIKQLEQMP